VKKNVEEEYVCGNCGKAFNFFESSGSSVKLECVHCKSDAIEKIQKISGICPACGSKRISDIEGFRSYLKEWFQSLLINSKGLIVPFVDYFEILKMLRTQVVNARKELPVSHHYSNLEKDLYHQLKLFAALQKETEDLIREYFSDIIRNFDKVQKIDTAEIDEFPILDEYLHRFQLGFEKTWNALQNLFVNGRDKLKDIVRKLDMIQAIKDKFTRFSGLINQDPNEYIVYCCECKISQMVSDNDDKNSIGKKGILFITTKSIEFIYEQGVLKKKWNKGFSISSNSYSSFEIDGLIFKSKILVCGNDKIYINIEDNKFTELINWLNAAKSWRMYNKENLEELIKFDLNAEDTKQTLENHVFELLACFSSGEHPGTFIPYSASKYKEPTLNSNPLVFQQLNDEINAYYENQNQFVANNEYTDVQNEGYNITPQNQLLNKLRANQVAMPDVSYQPYGLQNPAFYRNLQNTPNLQNAQERQAAQNIQGMQNQLNTQAMQNQQVQQQPFVNPCDVALYGNPMAVLPGTNLRYPNASNYGQNMIQPYEQNIMISQNMGMGMGIGNNSNGTAPMTSMPYQTYPDQNQFANLTQAQYKNQQPNANQNQFNGIPNQTNPFVNPNQNNQNKMMNVGNNNQNGQYYQGNQLNMQVGSVNRDSFNNMVANQNNLGYNKRRNNDIYSETSSNPTPQPRKKRLNQGDQWLTNFKSRNDRQNMRSRSNRSRDSIMEDVMQYKNEKNAIQDSIRELRSHYDTGFISHVDFFKTYQYLQKNLYTVDSIIKNIEQQI